MIVILKYRRYSNPMIAGSLLALGIMIPVYTTDVTASKTTDQSQRSSESLKANAESAIPVTVWKGNKRVRAVVEPTKDFTRAERFELMQGGAGTQKTNTNINAYSQATATLSFEKLQTFKLGNALFNKLWVASPSSTQASDGLGPFYNARACQACHIKDGRGQLPQGGEKTASLVLQLKNAREGRWLPDPVYGGQFHTSAVPGVEAEGLVAIKTDPLVKTFKDGTTRVLQRPQYVLQMNAYGELHPQTKLSPRLAPAIIGLGLLEAIKAEHILAYADAEDADGDGISGRPNWQVLDDGQQLLGRFGHKAAMSSVHQQNVHALFTDMGISSSSASLNNPQGDCTPSQTICASLAHGEQPRLGKGEAPDIMVDLITFYTKNLALPARRDVSHPDVLTGKALFYESGCASCHIPKHVTEKDVGQSELQFQLIWPYTDLLLHDMGHELADYAGEGAANGFEWRTAPLWGIGLAKTVNPNTSYLHDGRAESLLDAVLWHGGEAQASLDKVLSMNKDERAALVRFLESL